MLSGLINHFACVKLIYLHFLLPAHAQLRVNAPYCIFIAANILTGYRRALTVFMSTKQRNLKRWKDGAFSCSFTCHLYTPALLAVWLLWLHVPLHQLYRSVFCFNIISDDFGHFRVKPWLFFFVVCMLMMIISTDRTWSSTGLDINEQVTDGYSQITVHTSRM